MGSGIYLHQSGILGASPDGLIRRPVTFNYNHQVYTLTEELEKLDLKPVILEVKCPFRRRNMTIPEAIATTKYFCLGNTIYIPQAVVVWCLLTLMAYITENNTLN